MVTFTIEVISELTCSWCFVAHRALLKAIRLYQTTMPNGSSDHFNIVYLPYYLLDPTMPARDKQDYGDILKPRQTRNQTYARITQIGRAYGISFNFLEGKMGGTREAHRLIQLVQQQDREKREVRDQIVDGIFSAVHEKALDITDWEVLGQIAVEAGVATEQVDEWKRCRDIGGEQLDFEVERARKMAGPENKGVPIVFVQGEYRFDGAPDVSDLLEAFSSIKEGKVAEGDRDAPSCIRPGQC